MSFRVPSATDDRLETGDGGSVPSRLSCEVQATDLRELRRNGSVFDLSGVRDTRRASLEAGLHGSGSRVFLGDLGVILFLFMNNKLALLDRLCDAK